MLGYTFDHASFYPWSSGYDNIYLAPGGATARQSRPGWASWRQVWPTTAAGSSAASGSFDVSGVDVITFPDVECAGPYNTNSCDMWSRHPELAIAGWHGYSKAYVQIKAPTAEEGNIETAKRSLLRRYKHNSGDWLEIIAVKYDYQELWRWQLILNRFALSPGNTIGITGAVVSENVDLYESAVFLNDLTEAAADSYSDYRETIHVWALDAQPVANALPTLLPLLGIPVDAVGVVGQFSSVPEPLIDPQPSTADFSEPGRTGIAADGSSPSQQLTSPRNWLWTIVGVCMGLGLLALASIILVKVKKTRRAV